MGENGGGGGGVHSFRKRSDFFKATLIAVSMLSDWLEIPGWSKAMDFLYCFIQGRAARK